MCCFLTQILHEAPQATHVGPWQRITHPARRLQLLAPPRIERAIGTTMQHIYSLNTVRQMHKQDTSYCVKYPVRLCTVLHPWCRYACSRTGPSTRLLAITDRPTPTEDKHSDNEYQPYDTEDQRAPE